MIVGVPKEIKNHEYRVGLTPAGARALTFESHRVLVERDAGARIGFADADYAAAGAEILPDAAAVYGAAQMIVKVKELQPAEYPLTRRGQILFCYHHFAPEPALAQAMRAAQVSCVAYETVSDGRGGLPLLAPMSRIAGRLAPQMGAWALQMANGGSGLLLGGVPGVPPARVLVIGAGTVGSNATQIAAGMGADVMLVDRSADRLEGLDRLYRGRIKTCVADAHGLGQQIAEADLVIGAVLIPGKRAPKLITRQHLAGMRRGSVLVDVSIDQGGVAETSRPTTHSDPVFVDQGVVHYCVANMPSACARTSTLALTQVTLPHVLALAGLGLREALRQDAGLREGLQIHAGRITHAGLARDLGEAAADALDALSA